MAIKHRVLLTGKNRELINDIYKTASEKLEMYTSTLIKEDLENHLNTVKPDLLIFFAYKETLEDIQKIADIRSSLMDTHTKLILVGSVEESVKIESTLSCKSDLVIYTTRSKEDIFAQILEMENEMLPVREEDKKHILVIDDDPIMLKLIKEQLHEMYTVATAINGKIALKFLETKYTDLILLDYEMPEMNGPQVLNSLRERKKTENIPVVFLTGTKDKEKVQNALMMKPQGYLLKPIDKEKLLDMIQSLIG